MLSITDTGVHTDLYNITGVLTFSNQGYVKGLGVGNRTSFSHMSCNCTSKLHQANSKLACHGVRLTTQGRSALGLNFEARSTDIQNMNVITGCFLFS